MKALEAVRRIVEEELPDDIELMGVELEFGVDEMLAAIGAEAMLQVHITVKRRRGDPDRSQWGLRAMSRIRAECGWAPKDIRLFLKEKGPDPE